MTVPDTGVTIGDVRAWAGMSSGSITDAQLQQILNAETAIQAAFCTLVSGAETAYPDALVQALYRRCAREVSARSLPLGLLNDQSDFGPAKLPGYDSEIDRLEAPYRKVPVA